MSMSSIGASGPPPSFGPLMSNTTQDAKFDSIAEEFQAQSVTGKNGAQLLVIQTPSGPKDIGVSMNGTTLLEAGYADPLSVNQFQSLLSQTLAQEAAASTGSTSGADSGQSRQGTALYNLIAQISNSDPSTSGLVSRWNDMMQSGGDSADANSSALQAFLQYEAPAIDSGSLDLSA